MCRMDDLEAEPLKHCFLDEDLHLADGGATPWAVDLKQRIPRKEMDLHMTFITNLVPTATPAGSYRRMASSSGDIDVIVRESVAAVVGRLTVAGYIKHQFAMGSKKFNGVVRLPRGYGSPSAEWKYRHLDIVFTTPRAYPFALMYFTGPAEFNIVMRSIAKRRGLKLNEYGLWRDTTLVEGLTTERDIFAALGKPYKEPQARV